MSNQRIRAKPASLDDLMNEFPAVSDYRRELAVNQVELANSLRADQSHQANPEFEFAIKNFTPPNSFSSGLG